MFLGASPLVCSPGSRFGHCVIRRSLSTDLTPGVRQERARRGSDDEPCRMNSDASCSYARSLSM